MRRPIPLRSLLPGLGAVAAGGLLAVGVTAHTTRSPSSVTIAIPPSESYVYGAVSSPKQKCEPRRKVKVFRKRSGDDKLFGATRSPSDNGTYTITAETGTLPQGTYYSRVLKRDLSPGARHNHLCRAARSTNEQVAR